MATNGSISVVVTKWDTLIFSWETASQSIADNTSTVSWKLQLKTGKYGRISSSASKDYKIVVNGSVYQGVNYIGIENNQTKTLVSGSTVIAHNNDGKKTFAYSFTQEIDVTFSGTKIYSKSGNGTGTLEDIPRQATITSAPNFNDEENPTIYYSNPAGAIVASLQACISLTGAADDIEYRDISKTGNSYTFNLTDAERTVLRQATTTANSRTIKFYVRTVLGDNTFYNSVEKTLSIVNAMPLLNPTVRDSNAGTVALTGDNSKFVRYYSTGYYVIEKSAKKNATIVSVSARCGSQSKTSENLAAGTFPKVDSATFVFSTTDSRGNTETKTLEKTLINYIPLTANVEGSIALSESDSTKAKVSFTVSGNYFNGSFGAKNNTLTIKYTLKNGDTTVKTETLTLPSSAFSGSTYTYSYTIPEALDYKNTYVVVVQAIDELASVNSTSKSLKAIPIFEWGENDFQINGEFYVENEWNELTIADGFARAGDAQPRYKVCGSVITITGCITPTTDFMSSETKKAIISGSIPDRFCPTNAQYAVCQGAGMNRWLLTVGTDGVITMSRYGTTTFAQVTTGVLLPFTITYQWG